MQQKNGKYMTVAEAIGLLLAKGYSLDLEMPESRKSSLANGHSLNRSPDDFFVDEIFRCEDGEAEEQEITYVFAVSSRRYGMKGIVTNILKEHHEEELSFFRKLKLALTGLREYLYKN